ncbi:hypothetical protein [Pedobacter endophyticus]|uniref:Uncharacterized protein n=1 Tax=Pedobacter endophyticus TaxID=2789740 RepID=A0A7S9KZ35_9SPHI|nr:hypothetical protein [Pedobacter endophyticus]QPH39214.1 hypothetical protein IZT61_19520 [Pedobacter endophyticus]
MQLSKEELAFVKQFITEKKYIYVEEQIEILDHFISLLEDPQLRNDGEEFDLLVDRTYLENKIDLLSIQKSVKQGLKRTYYKMFRKNIFANLASRFSLFLLSGSVLYFWYLIAIRDNISILTGFIPYVIMLPISVIGCRRKFALAKGKFLTSKIASRYSLWWVCFQLLPCNVLITLGNNATINQHLSFMLISALLMIQLLMFRAFIQTALAGAKKCKVMEDQYKLVNA